MKTEYVLHSADKGYIKFTDLRSGVVDYTQLLSEAQKDNPSNMLSKLTRLGRAGHVVKMMSITNAVDMEDEQKNKKVQVRIRNKPTDDVSSTPEPTQAYADIITRVDNPIIVESNIKVEQSVVPVCYLLMLNGLYIVNLPEVVEDVIALSKDPSNIDIYRSEKHVDKVIKLYKTKYGVDVDKVKLVADIN